jgi:hypothetical protein
MSTIAVNAITDANAGNTTTINGVTPNSANVVGKNRIINGNMVIDQRNAGASVTPTNNQYLVDRFLATLTQASKFTVQQNAGSVTPPAGFTKYLGVTSLSAYSVLTGDTFAIVQAVEGFNIADLGYGTASAKTVTLSFQVYSSLTGTFGGAFTNGAQNRSYPFTYTISTANTWESKSITIVGDTTGTWTTDNSIGLFVRFGLGSGATYTGTAGAWAAGNYLSATGATSVVGTSGATFYITGVQLEVGESATEFEHRPYGTELQLCQRYYFQINGSASQGFSYLGPAIGYGPTNGLAWMNLPVTTRTTVPSSFVSSSVTAYSNALSAVSSFAIGTINASWSSSNNAAFTFTATGMSTTQPYFFAISSSSGYLGFSWEL